MQTRLTERVERIATDDRHGASWLAREAVEAVAEAIELGEDPLPLARELVRARPAMGAIAGALGRVIAAGRSPEQMADEARALVEARERAAKAIAVVLSPYIEGVVMTHSASATVKEALVHTPPERVVCTVSEPGGEGRELVEELRGEGLTADLVDDPDGTTDLTKAAKKAGVPVMVACEVIKLSPAEARDPGEERFDLTEPRYIDRYVTEEGEWPPEDIAVLIDRTPFLREGHALLFGEQE
jgi:translation initiation factor 2B subunit (eIF-2B alpha/beta/delta family)